MDFNLSFSIKRAAITREMVEKMLRGGFLAMVDDLGTPSL
jgi:hypothetical protein